MSHELRTPLTSVIGYSEMMLEGLGGPLTAEQREYLGIIMEKGENLLQLITSILDISKIEAGRVRLVLSDVDAGQIMRDAVATVAADRAQEGDQGRLRAARDPAHPRGPRQAPPVPREPLLERGEVHAGGRHHHRQPPSRLAGERVAIHVTDTGIGIGEEHLDKVFDVFYQVDGSSTREYGGAGLGLAIVKSFVEAHGGEVDGPLRSPGAGSVFTLSCRSRRPPGPALTPTGGLGTVGP